MNHEKVRILFLLSRKLTIINENVKNILTNVNDYNIIQLQTLPVLCLKYEYERNGGLLCLLKKGIRLF